MSQSQQEQLIKILKKQIDLGYLLEQFLTKDKVSQVLGMNQLAMEKKQVRRVHHCDKQSFVYFDQVQDQFQWALKEVLNESYFKSNLDDILLYCSKRYFNIVNQNLLKFDNKKEHKVFLKQLFRLGIMSYFKDKIQINIKSQQKTLLESPLVIADPKVNLMFWQDKIDNMKFGELMNNKYLIISNFLNEQEQELFIQGMDWIYKLNLLECNENISLDNLWLSVKPFEQFKTDDVKIKQMMNLINQISLFPNFFNSKLFIPLILTSQVDLKKSRDFKLSQNNFYGLVIYYQPNKQNKKNNLILKSQEKQIEIKNPSLVIILDQQLEILKQKEQNYDDFIKFYLQGKKDN